MTWHVYEVSPIDFNWEYLPTVESTAGALASEEARMRVSQPTAAAPHIDCDEFLFMWNTAQDEALSKGWEGDHRVDPVVMWVACVDAFRPGFVIKQDNNGTTYVVSPVPLRHLEA